MTLIRKICTTPFLLGIILALAFTAYWPSLHNEFTAWDDPGYLIDNPHVRSLDLQNIKDIFLTFYKEEYHYHPLTILSFAVEYHFAGLNPAVYHSTNLFFHLANTLLVFLFVFRLSKERTTALVAALLFGLHPMNVESVAWITARKNVLFVFFYLGAACAYLEHLRSKDRNAFFYRTALGLFFLSLLSKPAAVTLPLVLLLIDYYKGRGFTRAVLKEKIPFFMFSLLLGLLILFDARLPFTNLYPLEHSYSLIERAALINAAVWTYAFKLFWPLPLSCFYPYPEEVSAAHFLMVAVSAFALAGLFRLRRSKTTVVFGIGWFLLTIGLNLPVSSVSYTFIADRFVYIPYIGLYFLIGKGLNWLLSGGNGRAKEYRITLFWSYLIISTIVYFALTWTRCHVWKNNGVLWRDVARKYPRVALAHYFIGNEYFNHGHLDLAIESYDRAIVLMPYYFTALNNRGAMHLYLEHPQEALMDFNKALEFNPAYVPAYMNKGFYYMKFGQWSKALANFERALSFEPKNETARQGRKIALERLNGNE